MSIGVLEGGAEPPGEWGPDKGMQEFLVTEYPQAEVNRPPMTSDDFAHTKPYGRVVINLSMGSYYN